MIHLKTPYFWYNETPKNKFLALGLLPFTLFYRFGYEVRQAICNPYRSSLSVICVGNLTAGGSGKSPTAIAIKYLLEEKHITKYPCFLLRGYKGKLKGPIVVDPNVHKVKDVGDEALMLAQHATTIVSRNRKEGAKLAEKRRHDMIIMDDGLQNPELEQDYQIVAINGVKGFGNKQMIPAGPLRQTIESGFKKADCALIIGDDEYGLEEILGKTKTFHATFEPANDQDFETGVKTIAYSAIAHPDNFRRTLKSLNVSVKKFHTFPDHKKLLESEELAIVMDAYNSQAQIITTEKDFVKLSKQFQDSPSIKFLKMDLNFVNPNELVGHIVEKLRESRQEQADSETDFIE